MTKIPSMFRKEKNTMFCQNESLLEEEWGFFWPENQILMLLKSIEKSYFVVKQLRL